MTTPVQIPRRTAYKPAEVCAIAELQPYVLRSWEAEFPDLGIAQDGSRLRVYRRVDLDKVLRIKELVFVEGLTLGAAQRKLRKETAADEPRETPFFEQVIADDARARLDDVKKGLRGILELLGESDNGTSNQAATEGVAVGPAEVMKVVGPKPVERKSTRSKSRAAGKKSRKEKT